MIHTSTGFVLILACSNIFHYFGFQTYYFGFLPYYFHFLTYYFGFLPVHSGPWPGLSSPERSPPGQISPQSHLPGTYTMPPADQELALFPCSSIKHY